MTSVHVRCARMIKIINKTHVNVGNRKLYQHPAVNLTVVNDKSEILDLSCKVVLFKVS